MSQTEPIALTLGAYISDTERPLPKEILDRARLGILDTVGCMIGASRTRPGGLIRSFAVRRGAAGRSVVIGHPNTVLAEDAALANSTLAHMLELDDGHRPSDNHLGCVVIPTALAVAEETGAGAEACLEAVVVGYDVMGRVGEATLLPRRVSPFHGTGTTGVFGSAAVTARLLGLDRTTTAHALAIAGTAAAGLRESTNTGPDCKPLHAGRAAQNGIAAAFLAESGYAGPLTIFEGTHGFCAAMCDEPRPELICRNLGTRFAIAESGFKVHSTCGMLFNVLDGVLDLRLEHGLGTSRPTTVRVSIPSWLLTDHAFSRRRPKTAGEARFSIPFAVAAAIVDGQVSPAQMTDRKLVDPEIGAVESLIEIVPDPEVDRVFEATKADPFFFWPASVEIDRGGRTYRSLNLSPLGYDPTRPLTHSQVVQKFRSTVVEAVDGDTSSRIVDAALGLGADYRVSDLMALLKTKPN